MQSIATSLIFALFSTFIVSCGSYDNPNDLEINGEKDFDGDGLKNSEDPAIRTPNNPVKTQSGETKPTNNIADGWAYFDAIATFDVAVAQAPTGFYLPTAEEIQVAYNAGKFTTLSETVWSSTVAEDRSDMVYTFLLKGGTENKALKVGSYRTLYRRKD